MYLFCNATIHNTCNSQQLLNEQDERELAIKASLLELFDDWQRYRNVGVPRTNTEQAPLEVL